MLIVRITLAYILGIILSLYSSWYISVALIGVASILYIYLKRYRQFALLLVVVALGNVTAIQDMRGDIKIASYSSSTAVRNTNTVFVNISARIDSLHLSDRTTAMVHGIILGDRSKLGMKEKQSMRDAGMSHIIAVSGLHIGIIFLVLFVVLNPLRWFGYLKLHRMLIIVAVWAYVSMIGFPVSAVRAALMITIAMLSWIFSRNSMVLQMLASTALIMLLIDTQQLWEIGFQLSFLATLGIALSEPFVRKKNRFEQTIIVTLFAQLFTFPVVAYYFHLLPLFGWAQGILVLPVLPLLMYLLIVMLMFPSMVFLAYPIEWLMTWIFGVADVVSKVEEWCLGGRLYIYPSAWECVLMLALLLYVVYYKTLRSRHSKRVVF